MALQQALGTNIPRTGVRLPPTAPAAPVTPPPDAGAQFEAGAEQKRKELEPLQQRISGLETEQQTLMGERTQFEAEQKAREAAGRAGIQQQYAQRRAEAPLKQELAEKTQQEKDFFFRPSQEDGMLMAGLGSLIAVLGTSIGRGGKGNAMAALSGMNGMMQGYQQGRDDIFKKEKSAFETNAKALTNQITAIRKSLEDYERLLVTDKESAEAKLQEDLSKQGADFLKARAGREGVLKLLPELRRQEAKLKEELGKYESKARDARTKAEAARIAAEQRQAQRESEIRMRAEISRVGTEKPTIVMTPEGPRAVYPSQLPKLEPGATQATPLTGKGASVSGPGGAIQFRYNQAMTNAGLQLATAIGNLADVPMKSAPPVLAETLTNPTKGVSDAVVQFLGQRITEPENRAIQQILSGMSRAITTIEASGRPSGATEASIKDFGKVAPRAGDAKINYYLFLAESKQVMEILVKDLIAAGANEKQIEFATKARDEVAKVVNWNVKDINRILASGRERLVNDRVREQLQMSNQLSTLNRMVSGMERSPSQPSDAAPVAPAAPAPAPATSLGGWTIKEK